MTAACRTVACLGFAALLGIATRAGAGESCPPPCGHYETIVVTRCVEVPYTRVVTLYDHCGRPYRVERIAYRTVEVEVRKRVFVRD